MALFRKPGKVEVAQLRAAQAPRKGPPADELGGDAAAYRFRAELTEGRWGEFHDFLENNRDWDGRDFYVNRLADISGRPGWLDEWAAARPASSLPFLFRGVHATHWAWQARGMARAKGVQADAWPVFFTRLADADRDLARAAAMDGEDPTPHARGIRVALGLQLETAEKGRRFVEAVHRHRWHQGAHTNMIQALSAKWSGSNEAMFDFARSASAQAPEGNSVHKVIALAHLERWLNLPREYPDGKDRQRAYFSAKPVQEEIRRAADRSIRSASYVTNYFTPADRNVFAMCFSLMHDYDAQLEQMHQIGPLITAIPWQYQGNPGWAYEQARSRALLATRGPDGNAAHPPPAP